MEIIQIPIYKKKSRKNCGFFTINNSFFLSFRRTYVSLWFSKPIYYRKSTKTNNRDKSGIRSTQNG